MHQSEVDNGSTKAQHQYYYEKLQRLENSQESDLISSTHRILQESSQAMPVRMDNAKNKKRTSLEVRQS